jgi:hypothetical protein
MNKKTKLCLSLDADVIEAIDLKKLRLGMKRSTYINYKLRRLVR